MGNAYKGTFEIKIGDEEYTLRPSFDALCEFDEITGGADPQTEYTKLMEGGCSPKIIASALWAGIKGESLSRNDPKHCPSYRVLGEKIRRQGIQTVKPFAMQFLAYAILPHETVVRIEAGESEDGEETPKKKD